MKRAAIRAPIKLSRRRRLWTYGVAAGVWLTGLAWLLLHYFLRRQGEFGPETNPAEPWLLKAHGAFAFACLWLLGLLWAAHIVNGWHARRRRWTGGALFGLAAFLVASGYLLYYAGDDDLRKLVSLAHWIVGLGAAAAFLLHRFVAERAVSGKARPARRRPARGKRTGQESGPVLPS